MVIVRCAGAAWPGLLHSQICASGVPLAWRYHVAMHSMAPAFDDGFRSVTGVGKP